jgi:hypothetical protein
MLTSAVIDGNTRVWVVTNALDPATVDIGALLINEVLTRHVWKDMV